MTPRYFYIRFSNCSSNAQLSCVVEGLRGLGHVRDSGVGTSKDPSSSWVEVGAEERIRTIADVRAQLSRAQLGSGVSTPEVVEISRGEGRVQSRQLALF